MGDGDLKKYALIAFKTYSENIFFRSNFPQDSKNMFSLLLICMLVQKLQIMSVCILIHKGQNPQASLVNKTDAEQVIYRKSRQKWYLNQSKQECFGNELKVIPAAIYPKIPIPSSTTRNQQECQALRLQMCKKQRCLNESSPCYKFIPGSRSYIRAINCSSCVFPNEEQLQTKQKLYPLTIVLLWSAWALYSIQSPKSNSDKEHSINFYKR